MTEEYTRFQHLLKSRDYKSAFTLTEKQLLAGPDTFWLTQQARVLGRQQKYTLSLEAAKQAINLEPGNYYAILAAADALFGLKNHAEAAAYYKEVFSFAKLRKTAGLRILECLALQKMWEPILEFITKVELPPADTLPFEVKALAGLEQTSQAITACRQWLQLKPDYPPALRELVELQIRQDGLEAVFGNMERMASIPTLPPVYKEIFVSLCERTGRHDIARQQLAELTARSSDPWLQKRKAYNLAKSHREQEALPMLEELLRLEPQDTYLHSCYAAACKRIGRLNQALAFYEELLAAHPGVKTLYGRIKRIKNQLGSEP